MKNNNRGTNSKQLACHNTLDTNSDKGRRTFTTSNFGRSNVEHVELGTSAVVPIVIEATSKAP